MHGYQRVDEARRKAVISLTKESSMPRRIIGILTVLALPLGFSTHAHADTQTLALATGQIALPLSLIHHQRRA
jgi:hypothetical protein